MPYCSAYRCDNSSKKPECKDKSFFRFPLKHPEILKTWLVNIKRKYFVPTNMSKLCSDHFTKDCFVYQKFPKRPQLKPDAVPTIFSYTPRAILPPQIIRETHRLDDDQQSSTSFAGSSANPNQTISEQEKISITSGDGSEILKRRKSCLDTDSVTNEPKAKRVPGKPMDVVKKTEVEMCQELFETIMNHKTEEGRLLCKSFIRAPNRTNFPDYYDIVTSPIDLLRIEQKLETKEYVDIQQFTSDIELIFNNAKSYYKESSQEYRDACYLWRVFSDAKTAIPKRENKREVRKVEDKSSKTDDAYKQTGYDLFESEVRSEVIAANPDTSLEEIGYYIKGAFRQLPVKRQIDYEIRAVNQIMNLRAKRLDKLKGQSPAGEYFLHKCLWNNCHLQFEDIRDLFFHLTSEPNGHILQTFIKNPGRDKLELKCLWYNCLRTKKNMQPFSKVSFLVRHVTEVHLSTLSKDIRIGHHKKKEEPAPVPPIDPLELPPLLTEPNVEYIFEGKRLVNMGYFLKSLQSLNDHEGRRCNFSDMKVCAETKDCRNENDGIVFTCKLCPTTKVIWMEDPSADEESPPSPTIFKPNSYKPCVQTKLPVSPPAPQIQKCLIQPHQNTRKAPTSPPVSDILAGHLQTHGPPQIVMQVGKLLNYPNSYMIEENATLRNCPPQPPPFTGPLRIQPVAGQQVPATAQSQPSINIQTQVSIIGQSQTPSVGKSQLSVNDQSKVPVIGQSKIHVIGQSQVPVNSQSQVSVVDQSQVPVIGQSQDSFSQSQVPVIGQSRVPIIGQSQVTVIDQSQVPIIGQSQVPVIGHSQASVISQSQAPVIGQSQAPIISESQVPVIGQSLAHVISQLQGPVIDQTQLLRQLQSFFINQSQAFTIVQSQLPTIDFSQTASIKQELTLSDDETTSSLTNSSSEPTRVEMTFCVDQDESIAESGSVPSDIYTTMDVTKSIATTSDTCAQSQTSQWPRGQLSSSTANDVTMNRGISSMDALQVDLNLVKKEVSDAT